MGHTDTDDNVNGTPRDAAARAACTSPRRAYIPVSPTGANATGRLTASPNSRADRSTSPNSFNTRCRNARSRRSATLRPRVCSSYAPPSM